MKKGVIITVILGLLVGGYFAYDFYFNKQSSQAASNNLDTFVVEKGKLVAVTGATGTVRSNQNATIAWRTSGIVDEVNVRMGDQVIEGQELASLKQTSLPQNVILAQADLVNAKQELDDLSTRADDAKVSAIQALADYEQEEKDAQYQLDNFTVPSNQADLDTTEALTLMKERLEQAREAFESYKYLSSGNKTRQKLKEAMDEAQADYNAAVKRLKYETELEVAQAGLKKAFQDYEKWKDGADPDDIAVAESRIAAAQAILDQVSVTALFDGVVTKVFNQSGDQVDPGDLSFRLDDLSRLLVDLEVSEVDINKIKVGQEIILTFDAILAKEYHGEVAEVSMIGVEEQGVVSFIVTVELTDPDEDVKPSMTSAVSIVVSELEDVLLVPNRAVRVIDGDRVVYVLLPDGNLETVEITLGASSETYSQVLVGDLRVGDQIVLNPPRETQVGPGGDDDRDPFERG
jgi:HlyD family secretion protein